MAWIKKIIFLTGGITVILGVLLFTGRLPLQHKEASILKHGNTYFTNSNYKQALTTYSDGLTKVPKSKKIAFNLGLTNYQLEDYAQAVEKYKLADSPAIYLGNALYRLGLQQTEDEAKIKAYQEAVDVYMSGIKLYPEDIELKFNYEFVKKILDELNQKKQDQQNQEQQSQEQQDQEQQDQEQQDQEQQDQKQQDQKQQDQEQQDQDQQSQEQQSQDQAGDVSQEEKEAINQILRALEKQEETSLKNNQEILNEGTVDKYDW